MNRAMRRLCAKQSQPARQTPSKANKVLKPMLHEVELAYGPAQRVLAKLATGEIECTLTGIPIFTDIEGDSYQITPALRGFISALNRLHRHYGQVVNLSALVMLCNKLDAGMPLTEFLIQQCQAALAHSKSLYKHMDMRVAKSIARTEMIAQQLEKTSRPNPTTGPNP